MQTIKVLSGIAALGLASISLAATLDVPIRAATEDGAGANLGTVHIEETRYGLVFTPHLTGLPPGIHGFHVHEKGSCDPSVKDGKVTPAGQAGGHFDPDKTGKHLGRMAMAIWATCPPCMWAPMAWRCTRCWLRA